MSEELAQAWRHLEQESWTNAGTYERRLAATSLHELYAILIRPGGMVGIALDLPPEMGASISDDAAKGFVLSKSWNQGTRRLRLSLMVSERRYLDVFSVLACDVAEKVVLADTVATGCTALRNRLTHWKKFLKAAGEEGLSVEEQTGLYGELLVLKSLLASDQDPARVLSSWVGPSKANQDFFLEGRAVEVKSTTVNDLARVCIANERQLDEDGLKSLLLCHLSFDRKPGTGETLPAMVSGLLSQLAESLRDDFLDRLALGGYIQVHESRYKTHGYACRFVRVYGVNIQFPRIKQSELRSGVSDVRYFSDLSNINPVSVEIGHIAKELFGN